MAEAMRYLRFENSVALDAMKKCLPLSMHLTDRAASLNSRRSAEHGRLVILAETAKLATDLDLVTIKVPQICDASGISRATFYLHFRGRDELFADLMQELTDLECASVPDLTGCGSIKDAVTAIVDWYIEVHLANASLFQNLTFLRRSNRAISDCWLSRAKILHEAVVRELSKFPEFQTLSSEHANFVLEFVGGGMNGIISRVNTRLPANPFVPSDIIVIKSRTADLLFQALFGAIDVTDK